MNPEISKSIANLVVAIMSFLGWQTNEYINILPPQLQKEIIVTLPESHTATSEPARAPKESPKPKSEKAAPTSIKGTKNQSQRKSEKQALPAQKPSDQKQTSTTSTSTSPKIETSTPSTKATETTLTTEERIKKSVVNIYCTRIIGNLIQKTTGSGVVIDPNGIILTNAHVAEYFLLAQNGNNTSCSIRTGSPATNSYKAKLVYIPTTWVKNNKDNLSKMTLTGTGEDDYALLAITERTNSKASDVPLTYLPPRSTDPKKDDSIYIAGYPAGFSDVKILDSALYSLVKPSEVTNIASFDGDNVDVLNTSPTPLAEHGSSGGAIADTDGSLQAIIVATTIDPYTGNKNIQAITLPYIKRDIKTESGKSFDYLVSHAQEELKAFEKDTISSLANMLLGK